MDMEEVRKDYQITRKGVTYIFSMVREGEREISYASSLLDAVFDTPEAFVERCLTNLASIF